MSMGCNHGQMLATLMAAPAVTELLSINQSINQSVRLIQTTLT